LSTIHRYLLVSFSVFCLGTSFPCVKDLFSLGTTHSSCLFNPPLQPQRGSTVFHFFSAPLHGRNASESFLSEPLVFCDLLPSACAHHNRRRSPRILLRHQFDFLISSPSSIGGIGFSGQFVSFSLFFDPQRGGVAS